MERLRPGRQPEQDLKPTDDRLDRIQDGGQEREAQDDRTVALGPPRHDDDHGDDQPDDDRDPAVEDLGAREVGQRREERAAHQRPVVEDQGRVHPPAVTLLPNRSSPYVARVPNTARSVNRWLLPRPAMRAG